MSKKIVVPAEVFSRVSGYFRPVNQWNKGKREEFSLRTYMNISGMKHGEVSEPAVCSTGLIA